MAERSQISHLRRRSKIFSWK